MGLAHDGAAAPINLHKLTPLDIHNKEFQKVFRGYREDEVDEFLDLVVAEFERLIRINDELQSAISGLESRVEHYKGLEETLKNAIVLAQKTSDELKEAATREAEAIRRQAMADADKIRDEANDTLKKSYEEIETQRNRLMRFRVELKSFLQSSLELVEKSSDGILRRLDEDLGRTGERGSKET
jgi:cell division initiation protein